MPGTWLPGSPSSQSHSGVPRSLSRRVILGAALSAPVVFAVMAMDLFGATWIPELLVNRWFQLAMITPMMFSTGWLTPT